jgi:hypothetical protein
MPAKKNDEVGLQEAIQSVMKLIRWAEGKFGPGEEFKTHLTNCQIEFLKGIRSLVDTKIEQLESKKPEKKAKKATKISIE